MNSFFYFFLYIFSKLFSRSLLIYCCCCYLGRVERVAVLMLFIIYFLLGSHKIAYNSQNPTNWVPDLLFLSRLHAYTNLWEFPHTFHACALSVLCVARAMHFLISISVFHSSLNCPSILRSVFPIYSSLYIHTHHREFTLTIVMADGWWCCSENPFYWTFFGPWTYIIIHTQSLELLACLLKQKFRASEDTHRSNH